MKIAHTFSRGRRNFVGLGMLVGLVLWPHVAQAQNPTVIGVRVTVFKTSALTVPVTTGDFLNAVLTCGAAPSPASASTVNPDKVEFTDVTDATKVCRANLGALITALPVDSYVAQANFLYSDGTSGGTSAASNPFTRFILLTLQGLRFIK